MTSALRAELLAQAEPAYAAFQQALLPGVENLLGVRLPLLKKRAAALAKSGDWHAEFAAPDETYEEEMLRGMVIGAVKLSPQEALQLADEFVPSIRNWGVCDSFVAALKTAKCNEDYFGLAQKYAQSTQEYEARFAAVLLLWHFADAQNLQRCLAVYATIRQPDFYARMAVAWGYAVFASVEFEATIAAMQQAKLDDFAWNKALQKMRESNRITPEQKQTAQQLKRKRRG